MNEGPIGWGVVCRCLFEPVGWVPFIRQEDVAHKVVRTRILNVVKADKAKQVVLVNGKTRRKAKLIAPGHRFLARREVAFGIERAIVVVPVDVTVKVVRSGYGLHQNNCSITTAELGSKVIGNDLKFLDSLPILIFRRVVVVDAIYLEGGATRASAIEIDGGP